MTEALQRLTEREAVEKLLFEYTAALDASDLDVWLAMFVEDSTYKVMTMDNYDAGHYVALMDDNRPRMYDRVEMIREYFHLEKVVYRHVVGLVDMQFKQTLNHNEVSLIAHFALYQTRQDGKTSLLVTGRYLDNVVKVNEKWKFKDKFVVIDNSVVVEMPFPI